MVSVERDDPRGSDPTGSVDETLEHVALDEDARTVLRRSRTPARGEPEGDARPSSPLLGPFGEDRVKSPFHGDTLVGVPPPPRRRNTPVRSLAVGSVFAGDFKIIRALAQGGGGAVFEAEQLSTGRRRALKVLRISENVDTATRQRFMREARAGALIDSEHVVEVVVAGCDDATNSLWIAMEFLDGETLADRLARAEGADGLSPHDAWVVLTEVLRGLSRAHARGVIHRDLKPTNVFLANTLEDAPFTVKLLDFGIACFHEWSGGENKLTDPIGTPLWMAPEQARPARITPAVDVWAVGLLAFRLFAGRCYWIAANDATPNLRDVLAELLYEPLETASERAALLGCDARLPLGFDEWFARCVARDPAARFVDAREATAALAQISPPDYFGPAGSTPRRARATMHPAARADAPARGRASFGAAPRRPMVSALDLGGPVERKGTDLRGGRTAAATRLDVVQVAYAQSFERESERAPSDRPAPLRGERASVPPTRALSTAPPGPMNSSTETRMPPRVSPNWRPPQKPRVLFRVAVLAAMMIGGIAAILQAPGVLRPRPSLGRMPEVPAEAARVAGRDQQPLPWGVGEVRVWRGAATSTDARYLFAAVLRMGHGDRVSGYISWTIERAEGVAAGEQVRENVEGTYDVTLGALDIHGTLSTNPLVYPVNAYRFRTRGPRVIDGSTLDAALVLVGTLAQPSPVAGRDAGAR